MKKNSGKVHWREVKENKEVCGERRVEETESEGTGGKEDHQDSRTISVDEEACIRN